MGWEGKGNRWPSIECDFGENWDPCKMFWNSKSKDI